MHTHWISLLVASGPTHSTAALDKALNSTVNGVNVTVHTVHTTTIHAAGHWDSFRKDVGDAMRIALRPLYEWCIDDTLVPSAISVAPFAAPTAPPSAFWNAAAAARPSSPSSSYIPESLPTSSAAPLPKRVPLPTPASRLQPSAIVSGWGRWHIAPPTATPVPTTNSADRSSPTLITDSRLGPVAMPRVADSQPLPSHSCTSNSGFIGPRLPTSPIGSFNGTELPVPSHTCSPDDRPPRPRYIWTRRPRCPFNNGNLPDYVACPFPVGLSEPKSIFLDPPVDPRDPIIDLGPALDVILPMYIDSIVTPKRRPLPPLQRTTSFRDSIWFKVGGAALMLLFAYVLYRGLPVVAGYNAANVKANETIDTLPPSCPPRRRRAVARAIRTQVNAPVVNAARIRYLDTVKGTINGFFTGVTRVVVGSCCVVIKTIAACLTGVIGVFIGLCKPVLKTIKWFFGCVIGLIIGLWNLVRKVVKWVFVTTSRVVTSIYATLRNIVEGSFKIVKDILAYMFLPRFIPRRIAEQQPTSPVVRSPAPSAQPQERPARNSVNGQTTQRLEAGPSNSRSPTRLRSLPSGVADAIRAGNAAPSQVRRAGGRRVNRARPVRDATS